MSTISKQSTDLVISHLAGKLDELDVELPEHFTGDIDDLAFELIVVVISACMFLDKDELSSFLNYCHQATIDTETEEL